SIVYRHTFSKLFPLHQILFLSGLAFIIGLRRTAHFFFQRQKLRSSAFFLGGVALVLLRWPRIGMLVETYGFVLLFKSFFPMAFGFLAAALNIPFLTTVWNKSCFTMLGSKHR
uniref:Golgi transport 1A n=1 Tax=Cyprinus carpio TaxID=7962 RepID=A0A8C1YWW8_CYPCA